MKIKTIVLYGLTCLFLASCGGRKDSHAIVSQFDGFTQGTTYHILVKSDRPMYLKKEIDSLLRAVDSSMSLYNPNSLLSRLNRNETDSLDGFIVECIRDAQHISRESGGAYDITIKPVSSAYGFTGDTAVEDPNIDSLIQFVGFEKISVQNGRLVKSDPRVQIDLNSIAQGATSDYIADYFDKLGIKEYMVEVGGEIFCRGLNAKDKPWVVGIDSPEEGNFSPGANLQVKIGLSGQGLATSGNYRKFHIDSKGRKIVHMIDPKTGRPVISNLLSATVVAKTSTMADGYGTTLMVMGLEKSKRFLAAHPEIQAYLVYSDEHGNFQTYVTPELQKMLVN